jgi:hypothetical protein
MSLTAEKHCRHTEIIGAVIVRTHYPRMCGSNL